MSDIYFGYPACAYIFAMGFWISCIQPPQFPLKVSEVPILLKISHKLYNNSGTNGPINLKPRMQTMSGMFNSVPVVLEAY